MTGTQNQHYLPDKHNVGIADRAIGVGRPTFIIAEAGVNHNGRLDLALKLTACAKHAGADAVKFQVFRAGDLVVSNTRPADYQIDLGHADQRQMLGDLELARDAFEDLFRYCNQIGIEFLGTPFTVGDLDFLVGLGVRAIKLASTDLVNVPLVQRAIDSRLPVIASTGACTMDEIDSAVDLFANRGALSRVVLMHCISSYPTPLDQANLAVVGRLRHRYGVPVGFSDHTAEWITAALAVAAGASVLEKHFTLDRTLAGPDHSFSLEQDHLMQYVAAAREAQAAMGEPAREILPCEEDIRTVARSSVVSATDIPEGTTITPAMLTVKRPGGGIEPARIKELVGLAARSDISADTTISWDMLHPARATTAGQT